MNADGFAGFARRQQGYEDAPIKAVPIVLGEDDCARDAFQAIGRACLKQVVGNEPALLKADAVGE